MVNPNVEKAAKLKQILNTTSEPIAIKFLAESPSLEGNLKKMRYCQLLMEAKKGNTYTLTENNITCPAAAAALGFKPLPEKIRDGDMLQTMGLFESKQAASKTMQSMTRLKQGQIQALTAAPLGKASFTPDLVIIEDKPEKLMWITLATIHRGGGRLSFNTAVFQACCVDVTTIPYLTGEVNASLGCYGCRDATDLTDDECLIGIPGAKLDEIISSLEALSEKAIPKARSKGIYSLYVESGARIENTVNYDCSQQSEKRLATVFRLFDGMVSEIVLHTIVPKMPTCTCLESYPYDLGGITEKDREYCTQMNTLMVQDIKARHPEVQVKPEISYGKQGFETIEACRRVDPNLIVTGLRNTTSLAEILNGNEWSYIAKHCIKPVLMLK